MTRIRYIYALREGEAIFYIGHTFKIKDRFRLHEYKSGSTTLDILEYLTVNDYNWKETEAWWIQEMLRRGHKLLNYQKRLPGVYINGRRRLMESVHVRNRNGYSPYNGAWAMGTYRITHTTPVTKRYKEETFG